MLEKIVDMAFDVVVVTFLAVPALGAIWVCIEIIGAIARSLGF